MKIFAPVIEGPPAYEEVQEGYRLLCAVCVYFGHVQICKVVWCVEVWCGMEDENMREEGNKN